MLKALGIEPDKIIKDFEELKSNTITTLKEIDGRLTRIESSQKELVSLLKETNPVLLNDQDRVLTMVEEIWKLLQQQTQKPQPVAQVPQQPQQ
jgi:hypothetical protein